MVLTLDNQTMRRLWLDTNGLLSPSIGPLDVVSIIQKLGFVQLDTIQNVSRAHHHILWSRHPKYREPMLDELLSSREHIFEHFTHDASVLPMDMYPMWERRFKRLTAWLEKSSYHNADHVADWKETLIERITQEGSLSTKDFSSKTKGDKKVWSSPPHKHVLDYLWCAGILATSHREKFTKFYDLAERVIPEQFRGAKVPDKDQVNWLCHAALSRLAVGSVKEIRAFWGAKDIDEVKSWVAAKSGAVIPVKWQAYNGEWKAAYALEGVAERIELMHQASSQIKIINPFDPAVRDRMRLNSMFGFDYKLEVFVPAAKRKWGYYVYPLLEGDSFVGRIEAKADRKAKCLNVLNFWSEDGVKWGAQRKKKLDAELAKFARLANLDRVNWA